MWNYRIIRKKEGASVVLGLYEVMYNDDGKIFAHSETPEDLDGYETPKDLLESLFLMVSDVEQHVSGEKDILDHDEIKFHPCDADGEDYTEIDPKDLLDTGVWPLDKD